MIPPAERHARFQSITAAYDVLRGKSSSTAHSWSDPYREEVLRRKRFHQAHYDRRPEYTHEWAASPDDRWKDKVIIIVGLVVSICNVFAGVLDVTYLPLVVDLGSRRYSWCLLASESVRAAASFCSVTP